MVSSNTVNRLDMIHHELHKWLSRKEWVRDVVASKPDSSKVLQGLANSMTASGYPEQDIFGVKVTLEQVLDHSLKHPAAPAAPTGVLVSFHVDPDRVLVEVEDAKAEEDLHLADGEHPEQPTATAAQDPMTWVEYGHHHSKFLMLCKHRSPY